MDVFKPVYTEQNDCQDCYKCIRECQLKAIKVINNSAQILHEDCIYCGSCTLVCPVKAKKVRNDLTRVKSLLKRHDKVVVSLAPSYMSEFPNLKDEQLLAALKELGFAHVSETALGAEVVSQRVNEFLEEKQSGIYISSACPSVVEMICKHFPQYKNHITPFLSPLLTHCKLLKQEYGEDCKIVFIGPCIAKKSESDAFGDLLEASLSFKDLAEWFDEEGLEPDLFYESDTESMFVPRRAGRGALYPIDGGMIAGIKANASTTDAVFMTFSGISSIYDVLKDLNYYRKPGLLFLELLACEGGCINGPGTRKSYSRALKRLEIINRTEAEVGEQSADFSIDRNFDNINVASKPEHPENKIKEALNMIGKYSDKDEINCGGCGYNSCREFAKAYLEDKSEPNMCASYMRKIAHDKSTALLGKIPSGVLIVNEDLKVVEANQSFARIMGEEMEQLFETIPGLKDADLKKIAPFYKLFSSVLATGEDNLERDFRLGNKMLHLSLFTIQRNKIVGAILRDMSQPFIQQEEVINRAKAVNQKNLETVQKIAYLLGENASETEDMLNSIVEFYTLSEDKS
ncbi:PAS domain-containing protein [Ancylomarina salipaludis]|uniref:PAS domain-containing protein n=1 Tax=Ancylomarina salipaludis TaxID=2501299 RepID=A0A4Q1JM45_9BACT|nr:[Fe-Fe] hydrogenase large subunit C-terminal domain-containing protein [Ancylomarina salipaludis]RXQ95608.1 PAS domain-containing protein [Ancylomarina salipaludis]